MNLKNKKKKLCKRKIFERSFEMSYTIRYIENLPLEFLLPYIRAHYPPWFHFYATEKQLRYLALLFLDREGLLNPNDSRILREPYFGQLYASQKGNIVGAEFEFFFNLIPGASYIP